MINKKIILNFFFKFSFSFKKCTLFFFLVFFISFLIFIIYSNSFLLTCQEDLVAVPLREPIMHEFYILNKDLTQNYAKNAFMECLTALTVFFEKSDNIRPFYCRKVLGGASTYFFSIYLDILLNDNRASSDFKDFLKYLINPNLQIEDTKNFVLLAEKFFVEYIELYEKEWHPKGFNKEFQSYKNHITLDEISPLSLKKNEKRFQEIKKNLKFFYLYEEDGDFLICYSEYGQNRIKIFDEFIDKTFREQYKLQYSFTYNQLTDIHVYKLKNIIRHITIIQQILDDLCRWEKITSIFIEREQYNDLAIINSFFEKILDLKSLYEEIEIERKLIQELIFILYYPRAANGDVYFLKKLEESLRFLELNKLHNNSAYIKLYICDFREERTFKKYGHFLVRSGVLKYNQLNLYRDYIIYFYDLLNRGENAKIDGLKGFDLKRKLHIITDFLKETKQLEHKLAVEYLSKDTVLEIKKTKNYYVDFLNKTKTPMKKWRGRRY